MGGNRPTGAATVVAKSDWGLFDTPIFSTVNSFQNAQQSKQTQYIYHNICEAVILDLDIRTPPLGYTMVQSQCDHTAVKTPGVQL